MSLRCPECQADNSNDSRFCKRCATPLPLPVPEELAGAATLAYPSPSLELTPGTTFAGRYLVIEELGKGGMGKVYKVLDQEIKEKVALKLIKPEIAADRQTIDRFQNEIKITRRITHKNVCRMYHLGREKDTYYITMEFIRGQNLKKMIRMTRERGLEATLNTAQQLCPGLIQPHRLGIVHRDLKPQNTMIDEDGDVRIMDFGIASSIETKGATLPGMMIGTPEYMSPEQIDGGQIDARSDIYSLGIIIYELLTGKTPFSGETPWSVAFKHKNDLPSDTPPPAPPLLLQDPREDVRRPDDRRGNRPHHPCHSPGEIRLPEDAGGSPGGPAQNGRDQLREHNRRPRLRPPPG